MEEEIPICTICIKCEKEVKPTGGITPVSFNVAEAEKLQHGETDGEPLIDVEMTRMVGGCPVLSEYKWHGTLCEKCLGELVKNKIILE